MKKIALLLSLILVFGVVLASCGNDNDTSSVDSAVESSEAVTESSEEESSEAPVSGNATNLALNKTYTVSGSGHGKRTPPDASWPCNYDAKLTDDKITNELVYSTTADDPDPAWFSISSDDGTEDGPNAPGGVCDIVVDLESAVSINAAKVHMYVDDGNGIIAPSKLTVSVSADGKSYNKVASASDFAAGANWKEFSFDSTSARYVKFTFNADGHHTFIDELQVIGG